MTPQPNHLTEDQFGELLSAPARTASAFPSPAEAHLLDCDRCAAEFAALRDSLCLFRQATSVYVEDQLRNLPPLSLPARPALSPAMAPAWWTAAAALVLAAVLPMQVLSRHILRPAPPAVVSAPASTADSTSEDDQALIEDVSSIVSASVPAPMQELADPTVATPTSTQYSTQRKD